MACTAPAPVPAVAPCVAPDCRVSPPHKTVETLRDPTPVPVVKRVVSYTSSNFFCHAFASEWIFSIKKILNFAKLYLNYLIKVKRAPTPPPDVIEKVHIRRVPQTVIENILEQPRKPPPRVIERVEVEPPPPTVQTHSWWLFLNIFIYFILSVFIFTFYFYATYQTLIFL